MGSETTGGRFAGLRRAATRIDAGSIRPEGTDQPTKDEVVAAPPTASPPTGGLKARLQQGAPGRQATIRMSLDLDADMHRQIGQIALRTGLAKSEVVRQILRESLPELL
jgi:hypothetical protein